MSQASAQATRSVELRYRFDASVETLFEAWTDPEILGEWWGPEGIKITVTALDLRPGGAFVFEMHFEDGTVSRMTGVYREISPPHRLVFEIVENCNTKLPPDVEPQIAPTPVTVDFVSHGEQSEIVITQDGLVPSFAELASWGWGGAMAKLKGALR